MANNQAFKIKNGLSAKRYLQNSTAVSASDVDLSTGSYFTKTLSANTTFTFSNPPASGKAMGFALEVTGGNATVGYDLANAAYDSKSFQVTQDASPWGVGFKSDGTKMFVLGKSNKVVYEYNLSTAWDVSTSSYNSVSFSLSTEVGSVRDLFFKPDGTKMYITSDDPWVVAEYNLSTAWDITTASYNQSLTITTQVSSPEGLYFKDDGTSLFVVDSTNNDVSQYNLSTAWDVSTASYSTAFSIGSQETGGSGLAFNSDGTKMYVSGITTSDSVYEYTLSTAWSVSTASYNTNFSVASQTTRPLGITFKTDGTKLYITGDDASDYVYQYSTAGTSTATVAWPSSVKWSGATAPDAPASGEKDVYVFVTTDGGTTYYGKQAGDAVA